MQTSYMARDLINLDLDLQLALIVYVPLTQMPSLKSRT